jgi:hypothetical protein
MHVAQMIAFKFILEPLAQIPVIAQRLEIFRGYTA